ncbi:hypothetical protein PV327_001871 [Microctonus hyperodae]|uniref:Uncharacterized protein n=1 Tax=Microctonus hyperodae TaxID=165561 RepID=A0AA39FED9_MICHY|nr:hypothetical protein PV327_001871 [Microctonus hyperodae]
MLWYVNAIPDNTYETVLTSNAAILNRLGLSPLEIPDGHHKKRLAGPEPPTVTSSIYSRIHQPYSRRHGHRDSHVYVVKLPASPPYYTITKPHKSINNNDKISTKNTGNIADGIKVLHQSPSVGFHSNGKPAKIYHYNLPLIKKANEKKRFQSQLRIDQMKKQMESDKINNIKQYQQQHQQNPNNFKVISMNDAKLVDANINRLNLNNAMISGDKINNSKQTRNNDKRLNYPEHMEVFKRINSIGDNNPVGLKNQVNGTRKMYRLDSTLYHPEQRPNDRPIIWSLSNDLENNIRNVNMPKVKKHRKKAAMSYYAPIINKTGSTSIHKNFPGNGKPKAFYVMEKSRKPVYYHPLLP